MKDIPRFATANEVARSETAACITRNELAKEPDAARASGRLIATFGLSWPLLVGVGVFLVALNSSMLLNDADTYWHLAAGRWILEHGLIPTTDPFSHTMRGAPWTAHEWLAEVIFAGAYGLGGWGAVVTCAAAAFATALAILMRYLLRHVEPIHALLFVAMAGGLTAAHLLARPHILALPLLVWWTVALARARDENRAPGWPVLLIMLAWANLHGSFTIGVGLAAAFALDALSGANASGARWRVARDWARFIAAAIGASLLTPHGLGGWRFVFQVEDMKFALSVISEWQSPDFQQFQPLEVALLAAAAAILTRGLKLPAVRLLLLLGLLHLGLKHVRHVELVGLLTPIVVARFVGAQWRSDNALAQDAVKLDRFFAALAGLARPLTTAIALGAAAALGALTVQLRTYAPPAGITPAAAVSAAREASPPGPVFNSYEFGGYLIFSGTAPFIDGRADLYGDPFVKSFVEAVGLREPDELPRLLERYHIGWTLLPPHTPALAVLDRLPGWKRVYSDDVAVVHVRRSEN